MKGLLFLASCCLIVIVIVDAGLIQKRQVQTCGRGAPCKWALCSWGPDPSQFSRCEIMDNFACSCPPSTECKPTGIMQPRSSFVSIQYKCRAEGLIRT